MNDEVYYRCLSVLDRINDEAVIKFGSGYAFSKALGRDKSFWNVRISAITFPRMKNIIIYAKTLNLSVEYLLTGKHRGIYHPCEINCQRIYQEYKSRKISIENCRRFAPIMFKVKRGAEVNLSTLFELEDLFKIPAYQLGFTSQ